MSEFPKGLALSGLAQSFLGRTIKKTPCMCMMMKTNEGEGKDYDGNEIIQIKGTGHNVGEIC